MLSVLNTLSHLIFISNLWGRYYHSVLQMKRQIQRAEVAQDPKLVIRGAGILTPVHVFFNNYVQLKHRSKLNVILH